MPYTATREVRYTSDASALFYALATPQNSLLLESADIESKKNLTCIAITKAALKVVCRGQEATATALTPSGHLLIDELRADFQSRIIHSSEGSVTFRFALPTEHDERARLRATSTADILRTLQFSQLYSGESLPFLGGGFAFDYVATFEELPPVPDGPNVYPDYEFLVAEHVLTVDHLTKRANIEGWGVDKRALEAELDRAAATEPITPEAPAPRETISARASIDDAAFRRHVERLQDNVHAGDIYQVVPSRAFNLDCPDAFAAYRTLRDTNPSPYMFYLRGEEHELFGASPESNLKYTASDRKVQLYPVAGTRPRGVTHELDIRNELEMRTDSKEVSEHIMLVDLARNDLARVAVPGTRKVADLLQVDRYSRVMHLVSRVVATLHEDFDALDAYRACMNMGTLTGAPKLRAMELIRDTEGTRRGSFGGAIGYLRGDGSMDNCIVIRSAYVKDGTAVVQAGAGVVRDSVPQSEADETVHKAYAVLSAIAQAHNASLEVIR
ncbi:anthranilate synthase component 1 [Corynebacterium hesseae]|uniref:anthranilate synthase component 1 n=1 Tax=Corynebacterium hesseae TaxID=2913502 RepID=UPI0022B9F18F|nr:anthranilate synthase component 1 [Corynebacterium hesseae]MCZ9298784.1 anthranilate synthase component 1 [Corynebacterium hesseae]